MIRIPIFIVMILIDCAVVPIFAQESLPPRPAVPGLKTAKPKKLVKPQFPWACKCVLGRHEVVVVVAETDSYGAVYWAKGVSGHPLLRKYAEQAASSSLFTSTQYMNIFIGAKVLLTYRFIVDGKVNISVNVTDVSANPEYFERCSDCVPLNAGPVVTTKPEYPEAARFVKASGPVEIEVIVNEDGFVEAAKVISGHPLLVVSALKAARKTRFSPRSKTPVRLRRIFTIPYSFNP